MTSTRKGGDPTMVTWQFQIEGMHGRDCAHRVEVAIRRVDGVDAVNVQYLQKRADVVGQDTVREATIQEAVAAAGYRAVVTHP